jgi:uncharacterized protein
MPRWITLAVAGALVVSGCGKKSISRKELRGITSEIVAAAQKVAGKKSEVTIRPDVERPFPGGPSYVAADNIYVSLSDPAQAGALQQSLAAIARRHRLSLTRADSPGVTRFDLEFEGSRTHEVRVVMPLAARAGPPAASAARSGGAAPKLAIILDDLGYDRASADSLLSLNFPLTASVLPHLPLSSEVAEEAHRRGDEVMLHLPMESEDDGAKPEQIQLQVGMTMQQVDSVLAGMLETVPDAEGVNNHQGSRATADATLMRELMPVLREHNLFFIDSRTTASTVAFDTAERAGVPAASRKVFLDDTPTRNAVLAQLTLAARYATRDGSAIAIGHPHPATIEALTEEVPRLEARGIRLVFASDLVR